MYKIDEEQPTQPLDQLKALVPQLERGEVYQADIITVKDAIKLASESCNHRTTLLERFANCLTEIANKNPYYQNNPGAQSLLKEAAGLIEKIE